MPTEILDLFGDPVAANHGRRGRPQHMPTQENRNKVKLLLALGWSNERIAHALACTLPTLRKHYFSELRFRDEQRDRLEAALAAQLWTQVRAGNVGAMREFAKFMDRNDAMVGHNAFYAGQRQQGHTPEGDQPAAERVGKKEQATRDAQVAGEGSGWGSDLKPPTH